MRALQYIDKLSEWMAILGTAMAPLLAVVVTYDVVARYLFNAPTFWAYEISWMLYSAVFLLGFAHVLHEGMHVRVDILLNLFPDRLKAGVEAFFLLTTLLVLCAAVVWFGIDFALESWSIREGSMRTMWAPPVYYMKTLIVFSFFVLGLQGTVQFIRRLQLIFGRRQK